MIVAVLTLTFVVFAQTNPKRVSPDAADNHLTKKAAVFYPPMAAVTHIQGIVVLEISIDKSGAVSVLRLVHGHPMLAPAAIDSVNHRRYQPFESDGKAATVVTFVAVPFVLGNPGKETEAAVRAELLFHDNFWTAEESAEAALRKGDYNEAQQKLNKARDVLTPPSDNDHHDSERGQWMFSMGSLAMAQQKYDEAEQYYKRAQDVRRNGGMDALEMAATLAGLGKLYAEEKRYDLAHDFGARSVAIYQKNFRKAGTDDSRSRSREVCGREIAYLSWMLFKIDLQQHKQNEASMKCHTVLDFQEFLDSADHDSFVSACKDATKDVPPRN